MSRASGPSYLRLGRQEGALPSTIPAYAPWRRLREGTGPVVIACGPIALALLPAASELPADPEVWGVSELRSDALTPPAVILDRLRGGAALVVVEEHGAQGGVGSRLALALLARGVAPRRFGHLHARGYPSGRYGSQAFHRRESGIDPAAIAASIQDLAHA